MGYSSVARINATMSLKSPNYVQKERLLNVAQKFVQSGHTAFCAVARRRHVKKNATSIPRPFVQLLLFQIVSHRTRPRQIIDYSTR